MKETINFTLAVNAVSKPFTVLDSTGNPLADGDTVALQVQTVGVLDPGQVLFTVSGGTPPFNFALASGSIPDGDTINSVDNSDGSETVSIEGTPTTAGEDDFAVTVSDAAGASMTIGTKKKAVI